MGNLTLMTARRMVGHLLQPKGRRESIIKLKALEAEKLRNPAKHKRNHVETTFEMLHDEVLNEYLKKDDDNSATVTYQENAFGEMVLSFAPGGCYHEH